MLNLLIKDLPHTLPHSGDRVVWAIESNTVLEDQADIVNKLINVVIARVLRIRVRFLRVGAREFTFNGGKIHRIFDDRKIMGNVESDRVNGS